MSSLHIRHLSHQYGLTDVLNNISLDLHSGETLALVGPSGCGKSTLLHIIAGLLTPEHGLVQSHFKGVATVFQEPRLLPWKTAGANIALGLKALGLPKPARHRLAEKMGQRLGLQPTDLQKYPHALSGGMQSRVALGRALAISPDLLLLDEPFSALDVGLKEEFYQLLTQQSRQQGTAVLLITHDLMEAVRLADRIVMMVPDPGRILHELALTRPQHQRGTPWVYATLAELMQTDIVRIGFGLAAGHVPAPVPHSHTEGCAL
ncbi:MAG: ABC transporter ATP-binding protein [Oceanisphaera sp.]